MADAPTTAQSTFNSRNLVITTALAFLVAIVTFVICSQFFIYPVIMSQEVKLEGFRNRVDALEAARAAAPAPAPVAPAAIAAAHP